MAGIQVVPFMIIKQRRIIFQTKRLKRPKLYLLDSLHFIFQTSSITTLLVQIVNDLQEKPYRDISNSERKNVIWLFVLGFTIIISQK